MVSLLVASCCLRGTIPTPSSFKVETHKGSHLCWRPRSHEVPRDPSKDPIGRAQSDSCGRAIHRSGRRLDQPLSGPRVCPPSGRQEPVQLRAQPVALRALVGERSSHRRYLQAGSANRPCSITCASSPVGSLRPPPPPSTTGSLLPIALSAA